MTWDNGFLKYNLDRVVSELLDGLRDASSKMNPQTQKLAMSADTPEAAETEAPEEGSVTPEEALERLPKAKNWAGAISTRSIMSNSTFAWSWAVRACRFPSFWN